MNNFHQTPYTQMEGIGLLHTIYWEDNECSREEAGKVRWLRKLHGQSTVLPLIEVPHLGQHERLAVVHHPTVLPKLPNRYLMPFGL